MAAPPAQPGEVFNPADPSPDGPAPTGPVPPASLSSWILYNQPCCCGPLGTHQPMRYELFLRAGPAFPVAGDIFNRTLETGWAIQGGARVLFFNLEQTRAWTVELSISNIHNKGRRRDIQVPIILNDTFPNPDFNPLFPAGPTNPATITVDEPIPASIQALNRTFVNLGLGRQWYLLGDGGCCGPAWRVGMDLGGRWGTGKVSFHEIRHRTDVLGGLYAALHSDVEIPWGCCIFLAGFRAEWDYSWSDILQTQNNGDMQDIIVLGNIGVRF
jgi:hypothetical protein